METWLIPDSSWKPVNPRRRRRPKLTPDDLVRVLRSPKVPTPAPVGLPVHLLVTGNKMACGLASAMFATLNPAKVTCPDCQRKADMPIFPVKAARYTGCLVHGPRPGATFCERCMSE